MLVYGVSHDPFMAKLPGGGGSGRHDRARNTDGSFAHVVVVRISSFPLAAWNEVRRQRVDRGSCITPAAQSLGRDCRVLDARICGQQAQHSSKLLPGGTPEKKSGVA